MPRLVRNVGGTLRDVHRLVRTVGSTLQTIKRVVRNVGGTLQDVFVYSQLVTPPTWPATISRMDFAIAPADASATVTLTFKRDGTWQAVGSSTTTGDWHLAKTSTIGDGYDVRITLSSGDTLTTNDASAWIALSASRACSLNATVTSNSGIQEKDSTILVELRQSADTTDTVSKSVDLSVTATVEP